MAFTAGTYVNFVAGDSPARERLVRTYSGADDRFDVIVVGSGIGGGVLADDLADRRGDLRVLVVEAGSFVYPTHVYNLCRFPNAAVAQHFGCDTFWQQGGSDTAHHIGEKPQLTFGGRSVFWSGLIPAIQAWELQFLPRRARRPGGRAARTGGGGDERVALAGCRRGRRRRPAACEPARSRLLHPCRHHAPCTSPTCSPTAGRTEFDIEPTGVFNTAELLTASGPDPRQEPATDPGCTCC